MYQIDGPPKLTSVDEFQGKQKRKSKTPPRSIPSGSTTMYPNKIAIDRRGTPITIFDGAAHALSEINRMNKQGSDIQGILIVITSSSSRTRLELGHVLTNTV